MYQLEYYTFVKHEKFKFIEKLLNVLMNAYLKHFNNITIQHYKVITKNKKLKKIAHL